MSREEVAWLAGARLRTQVDEPTRNTSGHVAFTNGCQCVVVQLALEAKPDGAIYGRDVGSRGEQESRPSVPVYLHSQLGSEAWVERQNELGEGLGFDELGGLSGGANSS